jgi:hypothetical protein
MLEHDRELSSHSSRSDACPPRPPLQVSERKLQDQSPGTELGTSITVISTSVTNGRRTVVTTRALKGVSKDYYSFNASTSSKIDLINAVGSTPALSYHKAKVRFAPTRPNTYSAFRLCPPCLECASTTPAHLRLLSNSRERPANLPHHQGPTSISVLPIVLNGVDAAGTCVCNGAIVPFGSALGKLTYYPNTTQAGENGTVGSISFPNKCFPDLLWQKNPTCDLRTYVGGQSACHHMWSLLDADQEIPWVDTPLEYHMKFRFYVQPYNASYHTLVKEHTWGIASPVEYDVPKCDTGVLGCRKDPKSGRWIHTINGSYTGNGHLSAAHFHCHAPTCVSIKMYRNDTRELICAEYPVYGGTGKIDNKNMDEPGFITQPPCMWGDAEFGLEPPVDLTAGVALYTVKESYADSGHHGEMAWQQMYTF